MQAVIWIVAGHRYAMDTAHVIEVVPVVDARPIAHAADWVRGLMNFRGQLIPLVDAARLLRHPAIELRMANRILVVRIDAGEPAGSHSIGLLVERLAGVHDLDFTDPSAHPGLEVPEGDYLGPVALTDAGPVQRLEPDRILDAEQRVVLFQRCAGERV